MNITSYTFLILALLVFPMAISFTTKQNTSIFPIT